MLGSVWPLSSRATVDWLVPMRAANSAWERPARKRALSNSAAISNSGASAPYSVLTLGLARETSLQLFEWDCHVMSFARRNARSISARGVLCVFFTNARTTTTLRPIALAYRARAICSSLSFRRGQGPEGYARAIMTGCWICDRLLRLNIIKTRAAPGYAIDLKRRSSCRVSIVSFQ